MDISLIIQKRFSGSEFYLDGESYEGLTWLSNSAKPTEQELIDLWPEVKTEMQIEAIRELRKIAYTQKTDSLFFKYQAGEITKKEWLEARAKIAAENPYPEIGAL